MWRSPWRQLPFERVHRRDQESVPESAIPSHDTGFVGLVADRHYQPTQVEILRGQSLKHRYLTS
jgi:hypothetical protein